jgi:hypothetical protein
VAAERTMYPTVGIGLGTHVFLSEELSLDAIITVDHRWNFRQPRPPSDGGSDATVQVRDGGSTFQAEGWRLRDSSLTAAVVFGFSRWW